MSGLLEISTDGKCLTEGCTNYIPKHSKAYCLDCKKKRAEFFIEEHYKKMGWTTYKNKEPSKNWRFSGESCPKCGDRMIFNHTGHECGSMHCEYRK